MPIDFDSIKPGQPPELWNPDDPILDKQINYRERTFGPSYYEFSFSGDNVTDNYNGYFLELGGSAEATGLGPLDTKIPLYRQKLDSSMVTEIDIPAKGGGYKSDNGFLFCYINGDSAVSVSTLIENSLSLSTIIDVSNSDLFSVGQSVIIIGGFYGDIFFDDNTIFTVVSKPSSTQIELDRAVYVRSFTTKKAMLVQMYAEACIYISDGNAFNDATDKIGSGRSIARFILSPKNYKEEGECMSIYFKVSAVYST